MESEGGELWGSRRRFTREIFCGYFGVFLGYLHNVLQMSWRYKGCISYPLPWSSYSQFSLCTLHFNYNIVSFLRLSLLSFRLIHELGNSAQSRASGPAYPREPNGTIEWPKLHFHVTSQTNIGNCPSILTWQGYETEWRDGGGGKEMRWGEGREGRGSRTKKGEESDWIYANVLGISNDAAEVRSFTLNLILKICKVISEYFTF